MVSVPANRRRSKLPFAPFGSRRLRRLMATSVMPARILPNIAVVSSALLTIVVCIVAGQIYASRKLGVTVRFSPRLIASIFVQDQQAKPVAATIRHDPFTSATVLFFGDSHLAFFCNSQPITTHPILLWKPICAMPTPAEVADKARDASIVVLHLGTGDLVHGKSDAVIIEGYKAVLDGLRRKRVIVLLPVPINEARFPQAGIVANLLTNRRLSQLRKEIDRLCAGYPNVSTVNLAPRIVDAEGEVPPYWLVDGMHFAPEIYAIWWQMIREKLAGEGDAVRREATSGSPTLRSRRDAPPGLPSATGRGRAKSAMASGSGSV